MPQLKIAHGFLVQSQYSTSNFQKITLIHATLKTAMNDDGKYRG